MAQKFMPNIVMRGTGSDPASDVGSIKTLQGFLHLTEDLPCVIRRDS